MLKCFLTDFFLGPSGWITNGKHSYFVKERSNGYTYNEARNVCLRKNGQLTSVANVDEQNFINGR